MVKSPVDGQAESQLYPRLEPFEENSYMDSRLDDDPSFLEEHIRRISQMLPNPTVRLRGYHYETSYVLSEEETTTYEDEKLDDGRTRMKERTRKDSKLVPQDNRVHDFDISVSMKSIFNSSNECVVFESPGPSERVYRGTASPVTADKAASTSDTSISEQCQQYCISPADTKTFVVPKKIVGWDWKRQEDRLRGLIRDTGYKGHIELSHKASCPTTEILNACEFNKQWMTFWPFLAVVFPASVMGTFSCIISGPLRYLGWSWENVLLAPCAGVMYAAGSFILRRMRTVCWETVKVKYQASWEDGSGEKVYAGGLSEDEWIDKWEPTIMRNVLQGHSRTLTEADIERTEKLGPLQVKPAWGGDVKNVEVVNIRNY